MHTFINKPLSRLKMKRLTRREIGPARSEIMDLMARAPDPYASLNYQIDIGPCRQWVKTAGSATKRHILLTPILIKLIAHAIEENPCFNQIVFGSSIYQLEDIHIANLVYIPERDVATNIIMKNPHKKSLHDVQQELFAAIAQAKIDFSTPPHPLVDFLTRLCTRYCLYRIIGQRLAFKTIYERDLTSNIILVVHTYATPANFTMIKDIKTTPNNTPRIHASGPFKKPVLDNDMLVIKDMLDLHITTDHRIIHGSDSYNFGMSLEQIAANPEKYFT